MKHIKLIKDPIHDRNADDAKDKTVEQLYDGTFRRLVEVRLRNNAVLARHHADVPITVYCISGKGVFAAGSELDEFQELRPGTLLTLEAGIEHEVVADPEVHILVTKFKAN
ncbi:MAG: hypothetical protein KA956_03960 [Pyrinomonadaceae bacterium]|nr:hypothetical protein [Acidobacteriota bacterium]MBK7933479.1 hypothetical protein [Acidobacteriota bacterium]MBP7375609.1 hypothetical protein [Pyrinomonadaceae bacterium]